MVTYAAQILYKRCRTRSEKRSFWGQNKNNTLDLQAMNMRVTINLLKIATSSIGLFAFATIWTLAIFGMSFKFYIRNKLDEYTKTDALLYTILGCLALFFIKPIMTFLPLECVLLLALGGVSYLVGVLFYLWKSFPYNHAIWHLFVIAGAAFHFICVYHFVLA